MAQAESIPTPDDEAGRNAYHFGWGKRVLVRYAIILADILVFLAVAYALRWDKMAAPLVFYDMMPGDHVAKMHTLNIDWYFVPVLLFIGYCWFSGQYSRRRPFWDDVRAVLIPLFFVGLLDLLVLEVSRIPGGLGEKVTIWVALGLAVPTGRYVLKRLLTLIGLWSIPTAIVGVGENARQTYLTLQQEPLLGYRMVMFIDVENDGQRRVAECGANIPVISSSGDLVGLFRRLGFPHVVVALDDPMNEHMVQAIDTLLANDRMVDVVPPFRGLPMIGLEVSHVFGREAIILHARNSLSRPVRRLVKTAFDIVVGVTAMVIGAPIFAVAAACIKIEDGGPIFFSQERIGARGKAFRCLKFRSMRPDAEAILAQWREEQSDIWEEYVRNNYKVRRDPRITVVGRFLRSTSLDELPQLVNVLKGEMSIVGPRPLLHGEVDHYGTPYQHYCRVKPGITGLWQVSGRSETTFAERAYYDEWYIKNWSLWCDIVIVLKTFGVVLARRGAY